MDCFGMIHVFHGPFTFSYENTERFLIDANAVLAGIHNGWTVSRDHENMVFSLDKAGMVKAVVPASIENLASFRECIEELKLKKTLIED